MPDRPPPAERPRGDRRADDSVGARRSVLWGELLFALGVLAMGGWFLLGASEIRLLGGYSRIGPRFFPYLVAGGLLLCGALLVVQALRGQAAPLEEAEDVDVHAKADWRAIGILAASFVAHLLLVERLGFVVASALLFWGVAFGFGSRRFVRDPLVGLALATLVYLAFTRLLDLTLPAGVLPLLARAVGA